METLDDGPFRKRTDSMQLLLPAKLSSQSSTRTTQPRVNSLAPVIGNAPTWRPIPDSQRDNLLLRLPAEIRNWIYKLVLGGRTYKFKDAFSTHYARLDTTEQHLFGLLFVCRQIYFEAALLPYAINTFRFRDFDISLSPFLKERSPAQFRSIQSLELVTYQAGQMWAEDEMFTENFHQEIRVLARLPNLRKIHFVVNMLESLYLGWCVHDLDYTWIRTNMDMLERVIHAHRPDIIVTSWWV